MPTIEDAARLAVAAIDNEVDYFLAVEWARERYKELVAKVRFRHLRQIGQLSVPAPITAGTVSVTQGSLEVTGNATAQAAWSPDVVGRWLRLSGTQEWYRITALSQSALRLSVPYAGTTASAQSYTLVKRFHHLDPVARHVEDVIFMKRRWLLDNMAPETLNSLAPSRQRVAAAPWVWTAPGVEPNADGQPCQVIELYPYLNAVGLVHYTYWPDPPELGMADPLPKGIDEYVLREGILVDLMRAMMAKALKAGRIEEGAVWRNEYRAQETVWAQKVREAIRSDRTVDDLTATLERPKYGLIDFDIITARDQAYSRWPL